MSGKHLIKTWSRTQATVALSSAEAELYATVKASSEILGMRALMRDWGDSVRADVYGDASACLGLINRKGLGKVRHIDTNMLWVQEKAAEKEIKYNKILGLLNPSDLLTKYLDQGVIRRHMETIECEYRAGRALAAPKTISKLSRAKRSKFHI